jgi:glutaredoxin
MHIKIYSLEHCKDCIAYHEVVKQFCEDQEIPFEIVDLDLEQHVQEIIKYRLTFIPSTIFFDESDKVLVNKGGLFTIEELNQLHVDAILNSR